MAAIKSASSGSQNSSSSTDTGSGEIVPLKWVTIGNGMPANYDSWITKVNEYIGDKVGVSLDMEVIPWGDWDKRRNIIVSTNEPYDIILETATTILQTLTSARTMTSRI